MEIPYSLRNADAMPKQRRKNTVVSEPYPKKNAQQLPSKEQEEPQPSVDQSTDTSQVNESLYCDKCTESVDHLIQCENCETWYCSSCEKVPTQVMEIISGYRQLHWFCGTCETQIGHSAYDQLAAKSVSHEGITKQLSEVQAQVKKLVDQVNVQLNNRLKEFETEIKHKFGNTSSMTEQQVVMNSNPETNGDSNWINNNITTRVIDEYRDRESRKLKLILYNVPESQSGDTSVRKTHDTKFILDIASKIEAGQIDVTSVTRLGKKVDNKNRLMKVQVANLSQKRRLLINAKKLKQCSGDFQNIYLSPDLSYNERQANKLLRQELSRRREAGETDLVIYRGSIVKKPSHKSSAASHDMDTSHQAQQDDQSG